MDLEPCSQFHGMKRLLFSCFKRILFHMIIFSKDECLDWTKRYKITLNGSGVPLCCNNAPIRLRVPFPKGFTQILWVARQIERSLYLSSQCLVWVTESGIFDSAENLQLFYRYRQSYGSSKLLVDAPGHLCLSYERPEIVSLVWLCMLQGWDAHIIPDLGSTSAFVSHDQWFELGFTDLAACKDSQKQFAAAKLESQLRENKGSS